MRCASAIAAPLLALSACCSGRPESCNGLDMTSGERQQAPTVRDFLAVDSAQSWVSRPGAFDCPDYGDDTYRAVSDLIARLGVRHVRDRLSWNEVNPRPGIFNPGRYLRNADLLHERGIAVTGVFHDCPPHAGRLKKLPSDLGEVFRFCRRLANDFGNRMEAWEFWNEPDIGFAPEPVWDYAAALKAAYLGFKAESPAVAALPGALCRVPADNPYTRALFANDALLYADAFNYHCYQPPAKIPQTFACLRALLAEHGAEDLPVWVTECGTDLEGPAELESTRPGLRMHTPAQELVQAEALPKVLIALQMEGVARAYHFVLGAYNNRNGAKDWGALRRDGTQKPVCDAIAAMSREVGEARLEGELHVGNGLRAYLFAQQDGSQTVVYWAESPVDAAIVGPVAAAPDDALELRLGSQNLTATHMPAYASGLRGLKADVPARSPSALLRVRNVAGRQRGNAAEDLSIVIRADLSPDDFWIGGMKSLALLDKDVGHMKVQVWNLGDTSTTGILEVAGCRLEGLPQEPFAIAPGTCSEFSCTLSQGPECLTSGNGAPRHPSCTLVLSGVFNCRRTSRFSMPVQFEKPFLDACERIPLDCGDPAAWAANSSAQEFSVSRDAADGAIRFDSAWTEPGDRWFYPEYTLKLPTEMLEGAEMVEFEVRSEQDKIENDFVTQNLMLVRQDGTRRTLPFQPPVGEWERRRVELRHETNLDEVVSIRLGANPKGSRCAFFVRGLTVLKRR